MEPTVVLMLLSLLVSVLGRAAASQVAGNATAPVREGQTYTDNAALVYYQAWLMESPETMARLTKEFCPPGGVCRLPEDWAPDNDVDRALIAAQAVVGRLIKAAAIESCDFGNDVSEGPDMRLPHLARMRGSAQLLQADAVRLTLAGDRDGAAERVAALFELARHAVDGNTCIASLVSAGISDRANESTARLCAEGLTAEGRGRILAAIGRCDEGDPIGGRRGVAGEKTLVLNWAKRFIGADAGLRLGRSSLLEGMQPAVRAEFAATVSSLDGDGVQLFVGRYGDACDELLAVWERADAAERMKELQDRVGRGDFGAMAKALVPSLGHVYAVNRLAAGARRQAVNTLKSAAVKSGG